MSNEPIKTRKLHKDVISPHISQDNRGAAMIVVTCVMMVVAILCLTLVAAAYQMYAGVNDEGRDELYYRQVMSFSEVLKKDLTAELAEGESPTGLAEVVYDFWNDTAETAFLEGTTGTDDLYEIDIKLDKTEVTGCLIVTINCLEGDRVVASCKCKYRKTGDNFRFYEYY